MKRKMVLALCALLLMVPALASAEAVSITELREQVEAIGRWTQTYEAHGRTIEVDVPVIVPEVDRVPVLTFKTIRAASRKGIEKDSAFTEGGMLGMQCFEDKGLFPYLNPGQSSDYPTEAYIDEEGDFLLVRHHSPLILRGIKPNDFLRYEAPSYYPYELNAEDTYAEDNAMSLQDAVACLKDVLDYYYPGRENDFSINYIELLGRARKTRNVNDTELGGTVDYYPCGTYAIHYCQNLRGIPVYVQIIALYDAQSEAANGVYGDGFRLLGKLDLDAEIMSRDLSIDMWALGLEEHEAIEEDVPLAPLSQVIASVETEIMKGHIRKVYALRLGYTCYLNDSSPETYSLYPMWVLDCDYVSSAKEEISENIYSDEYRDGFNFVQSGVDAQTGEFLDRMNPRAEDLYCPKIITWEEAQ